MSPVAASSPFPTTNGTSTPLTNGHDISKSPAFDSVEDTIAAFCAGEFIIVLDSPSRENEGDLIIAAEDVTTEKMAFMIRWTSGLICAPLPASLSHSFSLPLMIPLSESSDPNLTAYTISIDASQPSITTGISAHDRALTCRTLSSPKATAGSFRRPGHVFPLRARDGGVRERRGHTEAAVEFCRLAGKRRVGVICELVDDGEGEEGGEGEGGDGRERKRKAERVGSGMMRRDGCLRFARRWGLRCCTIEGLVEWLEEREGR